MTYIFTERRQYLVKHANEMLAGFNPMPAEIAEQRNQDNHEQSLEFEREKQELELEKMRLEMFMDQKKMEMEMRHAEQEFAMKQQIAQQDAEIKAQTAQMKAQGGGEGGEVVEESPQLGANPVDYTMNLAYGAEGQDATKEGQAYPEYTFDPSTVDQAYPAFTQQAILPGVTGAALGVGAAHLFPSVTSLGLRDKADLLKRTMQEVSDPQAVEEAAKLLKKFKAQSIGANWKRYLAGAGLGALGGIGAHALGGSGG